MTRLSMTLALSLAMTSTALAQSADDDQNNDQDNSNQAGPVETNTNGGGLTREGNVIDRSGTDVNNPSDTTAPQNEQVNTTTTDNNNTTPNNGYVVASTTDTSYERTTERERLGIAVELGAGTSSFTNSNLRDATNMSGDWDVRLVFGTRSPLAFEASYIGSAQSINALGLDNNALLVGNGVQGALRLNATIDAPVQPFLYAGAAWRRYSLQNTATNVSDVSDSDNVLEIPAGIGVAGKFKGLILDARGEFRYARDANLMPNLTGNGSDVGGVDVGTNNNDFAAMHRWGINANIGYEF